jgi:hypothetical protein
MVTFTVALYAGGAVGAGVWDGGGGGDDDAAVVVVGGGGVTAGVVGAIVVVTAVVVITAAGVVPFSPPAGAGVVGAAMVIEPDSTTFCDSVIVACGVSARCPDELRVSIRDAVAVMNPPLCPPLWIVRDAVHPWTSAVVDSVWTSDLVIVLPYPRPWWFPMMVLVGVAVVAWCGAGGGFGRGAAMDSDSVAVICGEAVAT